MAEAITKRAADYSQWYLDIVKHAGMAENSDVRGCMVIKPHGYAIWERMQRALDRMFKDTGHVNAYFPLFIPKSFLEREEQMAAGREVYFGALFQHVHPLAVALTAFTLCTLVFLPIAVVRDRAGLARLGRQSHLVSNRIS